VSIEAATRPRDDSADRLSRSGRVGVRAASDVWRRVALATAGLGLAALALRLFQIGHEPLWLDEGYTLLFSGLPFPRLISVGGAHEHPPMYYSIVHLVMFINHSYLVPRVISAIAGALAVGVVYLLGRRLYGAFAGLIAGGLTAISPFHVWYGQDGRGYEVAGLFVVLSYYFLFRALTPGSTRRTWLLYAMALAGCLYAEYTTIFALLPQVLLLLRARRLGITRALVVSWVGAGALYLPWLSTLALDARGVAADYWIPAPSAGGVANTVLEFLGFMTPCPSPPCSGTEVGLPLLAGHEVLVAGCVALLALSGLAWLISRRDLTSTVLALWLIVPFALVLLIATRRSLYLDRIFLDATFPLYLLLGFCATRLTRGATLRVAAGLAATLLVAGASVANLRPIYAHQANPDWRSAGRDLAAAYRPGQAVVFNPGVLGTLLRAYLPAGWHASFERPLWSRSYVDVPGWQERFPTDVAADKQERQTEEARLRDVQFSQAARGRRQVWLVTYDYPGMNDSRRWFTDHGFQVVLSETYGGDTRIELWDRLPPKAFGATVVPDGSFSTWKRGGNVQLFGPVAMVNGPTSLSRHFPVRSGGAYSVSVDYSGLPPSSKPQITVQVLDSAGHVLGVYPRTQWYDWPVNGVWLSQPFGFVAPPGADHAVIQFTTAWGEGFFRHVAVYVER
jgi:4-amino-4-deoxy-L-arabinose transferase-like glycosyltransferase